jgi:hypothetical protein
MPVRTDALDDAFERLSDLEYPPSLPYVNHGPMACEALSALGLDDSIGSWVRAFEETLVEAPGPAEPVWGPNFDWSSQLGDSRRLPEWLGYYDRVIADDGWRSVVATWVPRLMPGLQGALFHGVIRTSHAVRAIDLAETPARKAELARALANWSTWCRPGEEPEAIADGAPPGSAAAAAAAEGARYFVTSPNIVHLHGVTGAMAVELLASSIGEDEGIAAVAQLRADHRALYRGVTPASVAEGRSWDDDLAVEASQSGDPHTVKLVEACRRGFVETGLGVFVEAAEIKTGHGRSRG